MNSKGSTDISVSPLFRPLTVGSLILKNRVVMAPMTRAFSPNGVPSAEVAAYYRRRAEGGVGLIITEGTWIPHDTASNDHSVPNFFGQDALAGWAEVLRQVHKAGGRIMPQLWHIGIAQKSDVAEIYGDRPDVRLSPMGPSGLIQKGEPGGRAMTQKDIDEVSDAYVKAAISAFELGFDGVEIHGAHGYLVDQFFWEETNLRTDCYGGGISERTKFAADMVKEIRRKTSPAFPIALRFSQWKLQNYDARPWPNPEALEQFLSPLVDAGVDMFDCSQRRFWTAEFPGSDLNLAGWTRKISGKPSISVGSVTLSEDMTETLYKGLPGSICDMGDLVERMARNEFDLIAVGRSLIANPDWADKVSAGNVAGLQPFQRDILARLE
ncbi:MAG: NADH:flavin oxidoreductase [Porticoccaceae bacterium]|nr:NADH:flavin oxidoreductase [Porticoccaceae bacterium]